MKKKPIRLIIIILCLFSIILGIVYLIDYKKEERDINNCFNELKYLKYISKKDKYEACNCKHDYLYSKYGDKIYLDENKLMNNEDSLEITKCIFKSYNVNDSINIPSEQILKRNKKPPIYNYNIY